MKIVSIIIILFFLGGCSDMSENLADVESENLRTEVNLIIPRMAEHPVYRKLGWGYDITGDYLSYKSGRAPIIDIQKFEEEQYRRILITYPNEIKEVYNYGSTSEEYVQVLGRDLKPGVEIGSIFAGTITSNYDKKIEYASQYSFASCEKLILLKQLILNAHPSLLSDYLSSEFRYDLDNYSADYVVEKYGTHLPLEIILGGKLSLLYKTDAGSSNKEATTKSGFKINVLNLFSFGHTYVVNTGLAGNNSSQSLVCKSTGGRKGILEKFDLESGVPQISTSEWENSVDSISASIIQINWETIVPIEELIMDKTKKEQLKSAVKRYMAKKHFDVVHPLYQIYSSQYKCYVYSTDPTHRPGPGWNCDGIICYVPDETFDEATPFIQWYNPGARCYAYTTDSTYHPGVGWERHGEICYVFDHQIEGSTPLYQLYTPVDRNFSYTTSPTHLPSPAWERQGIACYVYEQ